MEKDNNFDQEGRPIRPEDDIYNKIKNLLK